MQSRQARPDMDISKLPASLVTVTLFLLIRGNKNIIRGSISRLLYGRRGRQTYMPTTIAGQRLLGRGLRPRLSLNLQAPPLDLLPLLSLAFFEGEVVGYEHVHVV